MRNNQGFTLAEVLITLGVIGVVAAITIAPLVHKYKIKQYETAFKKTNANLQNAINLALQDSGYLSIQQIALQCRNQGYASVSEPCRTESINEMKRVWDNVLANLKVVKKQYGGYSDLSYGWGPTVKTVAGKNVISYMQLYGFEQCYALLSDGSAISCTPTMHKHQNGDYYYTFDTNGPNKKPNRIGYDIFIINNRGSACNINSTSTQLPDGHNFGCYTYALKNQSLNSTAKNYWESLK